MSNKPPSVATYGLIDISIRSPGSRNHFGQAVLIGVVLFVALILVTLLIAGGLIIFGVLLGVAVLVLLIHLISRRDKRDRREERRESLYYPPKGDAASAIYDAVQRSALWDADSPGRQIQRILQRLAHQGLTNQTYRFHWSTHLPKVHPIEKPFEPKILDETAPSFAEFRSALLPSRAHPIDTESSGSAWKVFRRNALLNGRWLGIPFAAYWLVRQSLHALSVHRISLSLIVYGVVFLAVAAALLTPSAFRKEQWYFTPGGLLRRTAGRRKRTELRLFTRKSGLLAAYQRDGKSWFIGVADGHEADTFTATTPEMDTLLRAWLSPLDPPPVESLIDYQ